MVERPAGVGRLVQLVREVKAFLYCVPLVSVGVGDSGKRRTSGPARDGRRELVAVDEDGGQRRGGEREVQSCPDGEGPPESTV